MDGTSTASAGALRARWTITSIRRTHFDDRLKTSRNCFSWTREELDQVIRPLGENGREAIGSRGTTPRWRCSSSSQRPCTTLPPDVRPGDQPAHRSRAGKSRHVPGHLWSAANRTCSTRPCATPGPGAGSSRRSCSSSTSINCWPWRGNYRHAVLSLNTRPRAAESRPRASAPRQWPKPPAAAPCCWYCQTGTSARIPCPSRPPWR